MSSRTEAKDTYTHIHAVCEPSARRRPLLLRRQRAADNLIARMVEEPMPRAHVIPEQVVVQVLTPQAGTEHPQRLRLAAVCCPSSRHPPIGRDVALPIALRPADPDIRSRWYVLLRRSLWDLALGEGLLSRWLRPLRFLAPAGVCNHSLPEVPPEDIKLILLVLELFLGPPHSLLITLVEDLGGLVAVSHVFTVCVCRCLHANEPALGLLHDLLRGQDVPQLMLAQRQHHIECRSACLEVTSDVASKLLQPSPVQVPEPMHRRQASSRHRRRLGCPLCATSATASGASRTATMGTATR